MDGLGVQSAANLLSGMRRTVQIAPQRDAREIIRLKFSGVSTHEIARRLGLARSTVRETLKQVDGAGLSWPLPEGMSDSRRRSMPAGAANAVIGGSRTGLGRRASRTEAQARHASST